LNTGLGTSDYLMPSNGRAREKTSDAVHRRQSARLVTSLYARVCHLTSTYRTGNGREGIFVGRRQVCVEAGITRSEKGGFGDVGPR
jgi:hypothetical protein